MRRKKKMKKMVTFAVVGAVGMLLMAGCGGDATANNGKEPLRVGTNPTFAPASYKDDQGNLTGFEPALMEEIGKRCGREVEWVEAEGTDALFGNLDAGKIDTIAFQISKNEERVARIKLSNCYDVINGYVLDTEIAEYKHWERL